VCSSDLANFSATQFDVSPVAAPRKMAQPAQQVAKKKNRKDKELVKAKNIIIRLTDVSKFQLEHAAELKKLTERAEEKRLKALSETQKEEREEKKAKQFSKVVGKIKEVNKLLVKAEKLMKDYTVTCAMVKNDGVHRSAVESLEDAEHLERVRKRKADDEARERVQVIAKKAKAVGDLAKSFDGMTFDDPEASD